MESPAEDYEEFIVTANSEEEDTEGGGGDNPVTTAPLANDGGNLII